MAYSPKNANGQATMANSEPVVIASDQSAIPVTATNLDVQSGGADLATSAQGAAIQAAVEILDNAIAGSEMQVDAVTLPAVHFQDVYVTGQGSQTALNQNIILATAGTGSYDTLNGTTGISFRSVSLEIVPAAGTVTAGVVSFEGSNDNTNFVAVFLTDSANITAVPVSTVTLAANTPRYFIGSIPFRYFRARISTGITGTTTGVQCFSVFSTVPYSSPRLTVSQATAASLNVTATGTVAATMAANATTTPAKARDGVAGGTDTGIPNFFIRRDTPTAVTPIAGDWEVPQISANGEQWVRLAGEVADDSAFTPATTRVVPVGFTADETATDSVDEGDAGAARMTLDRKQIVTLQPHTTGGLSTFMASGSDGSSILVATAQAVKASAGQLYGYYAYNPEAAVTFVHFYNTAAASVTVGTTNPLFTIAIPAGSAANLMFPHGVTFSNAGWSVAATTTAGGNTAPATGVSLVAWYM